MTERTDTIAPAGAHDGGRPPMARPTFGTVFVFRMLALPAWNLAAKISAHLILLPGNGTVPYYVNGSTSKCGFVLFRSPDVDVGWAAASSQRTGCSLGFGETDRRKARQFGCSTPVYWQ